MVERLPSFEMPADSEEAHTRADWFAQLLAKTRDAVICIGSRGNVVLFNQAAEQMFGYAASDVLGKSVNMLMAEPYATEHDDYIERYERTNEPRAIGQIRSVAARRASGEVFPVELSVTEVELGETARYGAFIRDISEKVRMQERLLERERLAAIGTTAASFAHEIGNPLNSMYMHAQLLERRLAKTELELDPKVHASVSALLGETRRLSQLLDEFRALARRHRISVTPTDIAGLVRDVLATETPSLNARGITVERDLPDHLRTSLIDAEKIRQVLLNLIKNAADAMPGGGKLRLVISETKERLRVEVHDTGLGIPEDIDPFEPFVTSKPMGTGLGLPVALQIVQAHGGLLRYEEPEGGGTVFILELPRRDQFTRI
ncbi:MAG: PAS domain S-box protein [Myxococcales bacterium]|nr:PAS domain S-box protein [Myxococcales bacterium]MCB9714092.1 PAS domain S-box protein [Myxococcales bacterium]